MTDSSASPAPVETPPLLTINAILMRLLGAVMLVHLAMFALYRAAMARFDALTYPSHSAFNLPHLRGDVRQSMLSRVVAANPCQFEADTSCSQSDENSEAVSMLQKQQLPTATRQMLETHRYTSAYDVARNLLVAGRDREAFSLLSNDVFDTGEAAVQYKAQFANRWYLAPAAKYAAHHREYDALSLFKDYVAIMRVSVKNGHWLSQPGLDGTDIPPIVDVFCAQSTLLASDHCLLGLLEAANMSDDNDSPPDLVRAYSSLPAYLRTNALTEYFRLWKWDGDSAPEPTHGVLSNDQLAAWNYAYAVRLLEGAPKASNCSTSVGQSSTLLSTVANQSDSFGYFTMPARHRLEFIEHNRDSLCQAPEAQ